MDKLVVAIGFVLGFVVIALAISMFQMGLWYCFDDHLATLVGQPAVGNLPPTMVWPATLFLASVFKGTSTTSRKSKD